MTAIVKIRIIARIKALELFTMHDNQPLLIAYPPIIKLPAPTCDKLFSKEVKIKYTATFQLIYIVQYLYRNLMC